MPRQIARYFSLLPKQAVRYVRFIIGFVGEILSSFADLFVFSFSKPLKRRHWFCFCEILWSKNRPRIILSFEGNLGKSYNWENIENNLQRHIESRERQAAHQGIAEVFVGLSLRSSQLNQGSFLWKQTYFSSSMFYCF